MVTYLVSEFQSKAVHSCTLFSGHSLKTAHYRVTKKLHLGYKSRVEPTGMDGTDPSSLEDSYTQQSRANSKPELLGDAAHLDLVLEADGGSIDPN